MQEIIKIGDKKVTLVFEEDLMERIDVDKILQIDYNRLPAEMVTFPVILNRLGLLLAESENKVKECQLDLEIWIAKQRELIRSELLELKRVHKYTQDDLKYMQEKELKTSGLYKVKHKQLHKAKKICDYINSLYWAAKDKSDKINKLSEKMHPEQLKEDLNAMGEMINGIRISLRKPYIDDDVPF